MSSTRSKKMIELVQDRHSPLPTSTEVKMLSDITNKPENQRYSNLQEYFEISRSDLVGNENRLHSTIIAHDCTERHSKSENSEVDLSDQDATYEVPSKKQRPLYPSRSKLSSISSSSSSSSSESSSDSSDTEFSHEENKSEDNIRVVRVTAEKQAEPTNSDQHATTEGSPNQEIRESTTQQEEKKKGRKRKRNEESWRQNKAKSLRIAGKLYINKNNKAIKPRSVQPPCGNNCRLKCYEKITADQRQNIFDVYWNLDQDDTQRSFIMSCMTNIIPRYKYTNARNPRNCNQAFHLLVEGQSVRVCKIYK